MTPTNHPALAGAILGVCAVVVAALVVTSSVPARGTATASPEPAAHATQHQPTEAVPSDATAPVATPRSQRLIAQTRRGLRRWRSVAAAEAAGFRSIGDAVTGYEHFVNWRWVDDARVLSPRRPESLVFRVDGDARRLVSAMYILASGSTMRDTPELDDERAVWHRHTDLCWRGGRVVGLHVAGSCRPEGRLRVTPPMLHLWARRHPCGPFAPLESHTSGCQPVTEHGHDDGPKTTR